MTLGLFFMKPVLDLSCFSGPIERQNVQLAQSVFDESTVNALLFYGNKGRPEFLETAKFLKIILDWWKTVNVKSKFHGQRKRDHLRDPITKDNLVEKTSFLRGYVDWLSIWQESCKGNKAGLSKETFQCAMHSSAALAGLSEFLLTDRHFDFFLTGKAQSDKLEKRFGKSRQMNGGNLYASVCQFLEADRSIRIKNLAKINLNLQEIRDILTDSTRDKQEQLENLSTQVLQILNKDDNFDLSPRVPEADVNILFYCAGGFAKSLCQKSKCTACKHLLVLTRNEFPNTRAVDDDEESAGNNPEREYLEEVNRGGLTLPTEITFQAAVQIWSFYHKLMGQSSLKDLLHSPNISAQRLFQHSLVKYLDSNEAGQVFFTKHMCEKGHLFGEQVFSLSGKFFNLFSKNYVSAINSDIHSKKGRKSEDAKRDPVKMKVAKLQSETSL